MRRNINEDGSTSYTLTQTEKTILGVTIAYLLGRRGGYYSGRRSMQLEIERANKPKA